jgi:hypothetical protein
MTRVIVFALFLLLPIADATAQSLPRQVTNVAALITYPDFFHQRPIVVAGQLARRDDGRLTISDEVGSTLVVYRGSVTDGLHEVRGTYWDLGRMNPDDPRLARFDLQAMFQIPPDAPWPSPGQVTALMASDIQEITPPVLPSIRDIALHPARFLEEHVTITGQFTGRNLLGDLPDAPANSRTDFVLRSGDAAIWVSHVEPRGKDFDLALDQRVDTGRWLEVSGIVRQRRGLQWIDATGSTVAIVTPPAERPMTIEPTIRVPAAPPPEAIFSAPTEGEIGVALTTNIRIQFSRNIDASTLKGRVRVTYIGTQSDAAAEDVSFATEYQPGNRMLEITFPEDLQRFRRVQVELLEGILGTDEQPLVPWTMTFETGG